METEHVTVSTHFKELEVAELGKQVKRRMKILSQIYSC